jgi:hypothetical protein
MERVKVVVRYPNNRLLKGYTFNFNPDSPQIDIFPAAAGPAGEAIKVITNELKAIFFVRDFEGNPGYTERRAVPEGERPAGRKVEVTFRDGEVLLGTTMGYDPGRLGFFVFPIDPQSNNLRVFVVNRATRTVRYVKLDERPEGTSLGRMNALLSQPHTLIPIHTRYNPVINSMWPMIIIFVSGIAATFFMAMSSYSMRPVRPIPSLKISAPAGLAAGMPVQLRQGAPIYARPGSDLLTDSGSVGPASGVVVDGLRHQDRWLYQIRFSPERTGWVAESDLVPMPAPPVGSN